jgi:TetR/AcrR family transcriptional repressor of nem operon
MRKIHSKEMIIEAGLELVLKQGFNATGVEAVLKQAKIPKGSFYNFFSSKEEFGLELINAFSARNSAAMRESLEDSSLNPLERIRKSFEQLIGFFEMRNRSGGCLIGNLSLEMAESREVFRDRLEKALGGWAKTLSALFLEAQKEGILRDDLNADMLAEHAISSYEGALLLSRVKKSSQPLYDFIHMYFDLFLTRLRRE